MGVWVHYPAILQCIVSHLETNSILYVMQKETFLSNPAHYYCNSVNDSFLLESRWASWCSFTWFLQSILIRCHVHSYFTTIMESVVHIWIGSDNFLLTDHNSLTINLVHYLISAVILQSTVLGLLLFRCLLMT